MNSKLRIKLNKLWGRLKKLEIVNRKFLQEAALRTLSNKRELINQLDKLKMIKHWNKSWEIIHLIQTLHHLQVLLHPVVEVHLKAMNKAMYYINEYF